VVAAGEALIRWLDEAKTRPTPPPAPAVAVYDAESAALVKPELARLCLSHAALAKELGLSQVAVSNWIRGRWTSTPQVVAAGEALTRWLDEAKTRPSPHKTKRIRRAKVSDSSFCMAEGGQMPRKRQRRADRGEGKRKEQDAEVSAAAIEHSAPLPADVFEFDGFLIHASRGGPLLESEGSAAAALDQGDRPGSAWSFQQAEI